MRLIDYVKTNQDKMLSQLPLNEVDLAVLIELSYLPVDDLIPQSKEIDQALSLPNLAKAYHAKEIDNLDLIQKTREDLFRAVMTAPRYHSLLFYGFDGESSQSQRLQFAAYAMEWEGHHLVVMRGTDGQIVGWQEDFNLAAQEAMPSQGMGVSYLKDILQANPYNYTLIGHSKGGNLVIEAALHQPSSLQDRIDRIYSFDGPGLIEDSLKDPGYQRIKDRIQVYMPQDSRVGIILGDWEAVQVVKSSGFSYLQHLLSLWEVADQQFVRVSSLTLASQVSAQALDLWLAWQSPQAIQQFFEQVFALIYQTGFDRWEEVSMDLGTFLTALSQEIRQLEAKDRRFLLSMVEDLFLIKEQVSCQYLAHDQKRQPLWWRTRWYWQRLASIHPSFHLILSSLLALSGIGLLYFQPGSQWISQAVLTLLFLLKGGLNYLPNQPVQQERSYRRHFLQLGFLLVGGCGLVTLIQGKLLDTYFLSLLLALASAWWLARNAYYAHTEGLFSWNSLILGIAQAILAWQNLTQAFGIFGPAILLGIGLWLEAVTVIYYYVKRLEKQALYQFVHQHLRKIH